MEDVVVRNLIDIIKNLTGLFLLASILVACGGSSDRTNAGNNPGGGTGVASLSWTPPIENTDGSALTNLAGYKIYYGTTSGVYPDVITINNVGISAYVIENLSNGQTYYFVVSAFNSDGIESAYSTVGSKTTST
ncbi:hypothetical protein MNBD_GAMMA09-1772 [hydrothermal vent metagenome]|uniref:Fibronectin type-III domain-containing protein n=1 Tax=hydrothermal vent metagenome TaxID=652676 RepID=A0A3B0XL21_9ZZZZ